MLYQQAMLLPPQERGIAVEGVVARCFQLAHFVVQPDARAAAPRQTDLVARYGADTFLIECKWKKHPAGPEDLDAIRARIRRVAGGAIGVLITRSGVTQGFVRELSSDRSAPVLIVDRAELESVIYRGATLRALLIRKLEALTIHGRVDQADGTSHERASDAGTTRAYLAAPGGEPLEWIGGSGDYGSYTPALALHDSDWAFPAETASSYLQLTPTCGLASGFHRSR